MSRVAGEPYNRGDVDDAPVPLADHQRYGVAGGQKRTAQVHRKHVIPVRGGHPHHEPVTVDAGVVHQDVQPAQPVSSGFHHGLSGVLVGNVAGYAQSLAARGADLVDNGIGSVGIAAVVDADGGPGGGEPSGYHRADAS